MHLFTIRDIENLTGIKAHTLRIWEQRYGLRIASRKQSNHRQYDNEDLKQWLRISFLYHQGWKISRLAQLSEHQVVEEIGKITPDESNYAHFVNQLIEKAVDFDQPGFHQKLEEIISVTGFENAIAKVCYPLLQRIGLLWMTSHIIPAQEHFCSYLVQHKIIAETDKLPLSSIDAPQVLLFCPHGEYHDLPLFYIHYLFKKNGWNTIFLGSNVTIDLLKQMGAQKNVDYLFFHAITNFTGFTVDDYFEELCKVFIDKKIVASGPVVQALQRNFSYVQILKNDKEVYEFIERR